MQFAKTTKSLAAGLALSLIAFPGAAATAAPKLTVKPVMADLRLPWDIAFSVDGDLFFTEKCHGLSVKRKNGELIRLIGNEAGYLLRADDLFCLSQSGVHGVALDPEFSKGKRWVYFFSASNLSQSPRTNRVIRVRVSEDWKQVTERTDIVADIAFKESDQVGGPGAHSGGRLRFGPDGFLWITTGDNHSPDLPQHPTGLGGKVLRVDRDGKPAPGNGAPAEFDRRIYTWGHRNPQGIAFRPVSGQTFVAEHGPNHSDEVTLLQPGGNAGWDPQNRPGLKCAPNGYCGYSGDVKSMPMTDIGRFPAALRPAWTNGDRSQGTGPLEFLSGKQWGSLDGALAVSVMGQLRLDVLKLDAVGKVTADSTAELPKLRLRSLLQGPDGWLWGSTDDGQIVRLELASSQSAK